VLVIIIAAIVLGMLINRNNTAQINTLLNLMSEKVNTSFSMMTNYIQEASKIVSARKEQSFEESYEELKETLSDMPYNSIGLIDNSGNVYATEGEKLDIEKHRFDIAAKHSEDIFISEPYRSSVTGSNMITMFAPIYNNDKRIGSVFITYYLETVQNLAHTEFLSDQTKVFLMDAYSGNYVVCSGDENNPTGSWSNIRLIKNDIECLNGYDIDEWIETMKTESSNNIINFKLDGVTYAQASVNISGMDNWNIVIRLPVAELSSAVGQYTIVIIICAALIIIATLLFTGSAYLKEHKQKTTLEVLSDIDPLTKVVNRRGLDNILTDYFTDKHNAANRITYIYLDVDLFKNVNDNYGHDAGDQVLYNVAAILTDIFKAAATVARVGGDEFNIFVYEPLSIADLDNLMAHLRVRLNELKLNDGTSLPVTFSAGLAVMPDDAQTLEDVKQCADEALYYVKENGRSNHYWYHDLKKQDK
jgi:diguanylate cyclase (GGDEF)-like protein